MFASSFSFYSFFHHSFFCVQAVCYDQIDVGDGSDKGHGSNFAQQPCMHHCIDKMHLVSMAANLALGQEEELGSQTLCLPHHFLCTAFSIIVSFHLLLNDLVG